MTCWCRWQVVPETRFLRREPGGAGGRRRDDAPLSAGGVRPAPAAGQLGAQDTHQDEHDLRGPAL